MKEGEHVGLERAEHRDQQLQRIIEGDCDPCAARDPVTQSFAEDASLLGELAVCESPCCRS